MADLAPGSRCPGCGAPELEAAGAPRRRRLVCTHCGRCWEAGGAHAEVDTLACPGCDRREVCESRPTSLVAERTRDLELTDGTPVVVRPLLYSDRFQLAEAYAHLTPHSRHLRFFSPPEVLTETDLEYLTNLDYRDHYALGAFTSREPHARGIGVARYVREPDAATAEVAVTVVDEFQHRGLGSLLMQRLAEVAAGKGVRAFVNYVLWDNAEIIALLQQEGAVVTPDEPGIARVELALPEDGSSVPTWSLHRVLHAFADHIRQILEAAAA